jgi:hypothetical protein
MLLDVHNGSSEPLNGIAVNCRNVGRNPKGLNPSAGSSHIKLIGGWCVAGYIFVVTAVHLVGLYA